MAFRRPAVNTPLLLLVLALPALARGQAEGPPPTGAPAVPDALPQPADQTGETAETADEVLPEALEPSGVRALPERLDYRTVLDRARSGDLRVVAARHQLDAFEAQYRQARWAWFPAFTTTLTAGGPVPEARVRPGSDDPLDVTDASYTDDLDLGRVGLLLRGRVEATVPLWTFGKLDHLEQAAARLVEVGAAEVSRTQDEVTMDAARAWFGYQSTRQALASVQEGLDRGRDALRQIDALLEEQSEQVVVEDRYKIQVLIDYLRAQQARLEEARHIAAAALGLLADVPPEAQVPIVEEDVVLPERVPRDLEALMSEARDRRPELSALAAGVQARENEVAVRRAMRYPDLLLAGFGEVSWSNAATDQHNPFIYDPYNFLTAGLGLVVRATFDFPQKEAQVDRSEAELRRLRTQLGAASRAVRLEVESAARELWAATSEASRLEEAERTARRWTIAATANFEIGLVEVRDVIEPIAALVATSTGRAQAVYRARLAEAALAKAVGVLPWDLPAGEVPPGADGAGE